MIQAAKVQRVADMSASEETSMTTTNFMVELTALTTMAHCLRKHGQGKYTWEQLHKQRESLEGRLTGLWVVYNEEYECYSLIPREYAINTPRGEN